MRHARCVVMAMVIGAMMAVAGLCAPRAASTQPTGVTPELQAALERVDAALLELVQGKAETFKALWSRRDDVTLTGGLGGGIEKGWERVSKRLDWAGTQFSEGTRTYQQLVLNASGDLAYVVQIEKLRYRAPGQQAPADRELRVTMVLRREAEGWRIVHRHADSQVTQQAPR